MGDVLKWAALIVAVYIGWNFFRGRGVGASFAAYPSPGSPYGYGYGQPQGYNYGNGAVAGYVGFSGGPVRGGVSF